MSFGSMSDMLSIAKMLQKGNPDADSESEKEDEVEEKRTGGGGFGLAGKNTDKGGQNPLFKSVIKGNALADDEEVNATNKPIAAEESIEEVQKRLEEKQQRRQMRRLKKEVEAERKYQAEKEAVEKANEVVKDPKAIWDDSEVPADDLIEDEDTTNDDREEAEFEILYKQNVSAEDAYLNMGMKDPSSRHCDAIIVRIKLPGDKFKDVNLQVTSHKLYVGTPKHKLFLHLPHRCDEDKGNAKFDAKTDVLAVTLPIFQDDF